MKDRKARKENGSKRMRKRLCDGDKQPVSHQIESKIITYQEFCNKTFVCLLLSYFAVVLLWLYFENCVIVLLFFYIIFFCADSALVKLLYIIAIINNCAKVLNKICSTRHEFLSLSIWPSTPLSLSLSLSRYVFLFFFVCWPIQSVCVFGNFLYLLFQYVRANIR